MHTALRVVQNASGGIARGGIVRSITAVLAVLSGLLVFQPTAQAAGPCDAPVQSVIQCENSKAGTAKSQWDVTGTGSSNILGFTNDISYAPGAVVDFRIKTTSSKYRLDLYRMGYYGGAGARKITTVRPSVTLPQTQPGCRNDTTTGLIDCGNWKISAKWTIPSSAVSGIYFAKLVREDGTAGNNHIVFIVRNDNSGSKLLFQTSDTTWQAYNKYGGNSLYAGKPANRAYKVSYNRPLTVRSTAPQDSVFNAEYPMVRWLEANGYDVSYTTGVDTARRGSELLEHKVFLSVGHDEYWSGPQRANVEAARNAGVNLAFFSGNEVYWKTRWENSTTSPITSYRTLVSYKESKDNAKIDPDPAWTGTWRDNRFSPPSDGGRPENALTGQLFMVNGPQSEAIKVPQPDGLLRLWRNTSVATLGTGEVATFPAGTLGYEWDEDIDNGFRPAGMVPFSTTTVDVQTRLQDLCCTYGPGTATHRLTLYRHSSGALVFGAGTIQWSWGLDANHDRSGPPSDVRMQQATVNLLADMGVQPASLQAPLTAASASSDTVAPTTAITSPLSGATLPMSSPVTISGTAGDTGGGRVGAVEVSTDNGGTWHRATGRESWSYSWTPSASGPVTLRARAADDSVNLGAAVSLAVTVGSGAPADTTPPTVTSQTPASGATGVSQGTNVLAVFSEPMQASTIDLQLKDPSGTVVAAAVSHDGSTNTTKLDPTANLTPNTTYTASISNALDAAGNNLTGPVNWSFSTAACPCTIWAPTSAPGAIETGDTAAVEVGLKFRSDVKGFISGVRYYRGANVAGTRTGSLWKKDGTLLAQATFTGESATGWQQVTFSSPVAIAANTTYIVSYHTTTGAYAADLYAFKNAGVDSPPLHALKAGVDGGNGVYMYNATPKFPSNAAPKQTNYWVDVVFTTS
ncbi:MAG: N,N-dimethylformamidase beta subunit family domain-containing protein [Acidimicrobiales bacterium]